ncbi:sugar-binding transcriptional regulator [Salinisphaera sp. LB1]|uniref:sugar-binding transcriptional regulator n=1 Tax=Salinisphaera sp. LB1 TaxID=2183911 RepID=UPI000D708D00|nr:sugar-binding transcriptional regulator [Salinisphaera sp. LB1]AWN16100.1 Putative transcriptional regulator of sorbose uptake and utilization genes [Salinisphaera sp. LB1]
MSPDELTELAKLYHIDGWTQEELASRFEISRVKVGRLLKRAVAEGIVEIRVRLQHPPNTTAALEKALKERFDIRRAIISVDHKDPERQRELLAGLVARYLDQSLTETSVVAVGMGRNVSAVPEQVVSNQRRHCSFVCAIGGSYRGGEAMNSDQICRHMAMRFGGESVTLYAPAIVADPQIRDALLANDTVRQSLNKAQHADVAVVGVGDILEDSNMVRMGWFTNEEISTLRQLGVVGDIMGYDFIDIDGNLAETPLIGRVIGLTIEHLHDIPDVIAMASEPTKVTGILGALRTGAIDTLATTQSIAQTVLNLAQATDSVAARSSATS